MSQYPGGQWPQPPQDPYFGQAPADPYAAPPPQAGDPYAGQAPSVDPYGVPQDPYYGGVPAPEVVAQQQAYYAQQQAYYAQQQAWQAQQQAGSEARRGRGGAGAAIVGILLVLAGAWILFGDQIDLDFGQVWPIAVVALGLVMVVAAFVPGRGREGR